MIILFRIWVRILRLDSSVVRVCVHIFSMASKRTCLQFFVLIWYLLRSQNCEANNVEQKLTQKFAWKTIEYAWESNSVEQKSQRNYIPENNLPFSFDVSNDRLFISIPRYV